jgi:uncharacterized protein YndB with AHSA1/START domain
MTRTKSNADVPVGTATPAASGTYREPGHFAKRVTSDTVRFERLLPGPMERVWEYLTDSEKRGKWLASGAMPPRAGADFTMTFAHASLSPNKAPTPEKFRQYEPSVDSKHKVLKYEPTRFLSISWGGTAEGASEVDFELTPEGNKVRLVITHRRLGGRDEMVSVSGGWHTHLAILEEKLNDRVPPSFWTLFGDIESQYEQRY